MESCSTKVLAKTDQIVDNCWQIMYHLFNCEEEREARLGKNMNETEGVYTGNQDSSETGNNDRLRNLDSINLEWRIL